MTLDEKSAICLALIAEAPDRNAELLKLLEGEPKLIGQAIIALGRGSLPSSSPVVEVAKEIMKWAQSNRRTTTSRTVVAQPLVAAR